VASSYGESSAHLGVEVEQGRLRATVGVVRFVQQAPRYAVVGGVAWRVR
jgi:hypothetical protein